MLASWLCAVFTSSVGNEVTVAIIALSIFPFLNEVKNRLGGESAPCWLGLADNCLLHRRLHKLYLCT